MKIVTTNLLNRFWKNGINPIKEALSTTLKKTDIVDHLLATVKGKPLDSTQGKKLKDLHDALESQVTALNRNLSETGTMVKIASTAATSYQTFTVNTSLYKSYVLMCTRSGGTNEYIPIASTIIPADNISYINSDTKCSQASYADEPSNYGVRCYFSGTTVYLKSKSQYDCAVLYGVK